MPWFLDPSGSHPGWQPRPRPGPRKAGLRPWPPPRPRVNSLPPSPSSALRTVAGGGGPRTAAEGTLTAVQPTAQGPGCRPWTLSRNGSIAPALPTRGRTTRTAASSLGSAALAGPGAERGRGRAWGPGPLDLLHGSPAWWLLLDPPLHNPICNPSPNINGYFTKIFVDAPPSTTARTSRKVSGRKAGGKKGR